MLFWCYFSTFFPFLKRLYEYFISLAKESVKNVGTGSFGADMQVSLLNDGPVTIVMDSKMLGKGKAQ